MSEDEIENELSGLMTGTEATPRTTDQKDNNPIDAEVCGENLAESSTSRKREVTGGCNFDLIMKQFTNYFKTQNMH